MDLDQDLDTDIIASTSGGIVAWWENLDGMGTSWHERTLTTTFGGANVLVAADLDGDQQLDVISGNFSTTAWWGDPFLSLVEFESPIATSPLPDGATLYAYLANATEPSAEGRWTAAGWIRTGSSPGTGTGLETDAFTLSGETSITFD